MNMISKWSKPEIGISFPEPSWRSWDEIVNSLLRSMGGANEGAGDLMNVNVGEHEVTVSLPCAGYKPGDFEVEVVGDCLTVTAKKEECGCDSGDGKFIRRERSCGEFSESITLPVQVLGNGATAAYRDGILTVTLPREQAGHKSTHSIQVEQ